MRRSVLVVLSTALALAAWAGVARAPAATGAVASHDRPSSYVLPGDAVFPEGVAADTRTDRFYVGSTTDGTIFRGHLDDPTAEVFLPGGADGRTTAVGLKVDRGLLYVSGGGTGKVFVYDTATKALLATFDNELTATFINDVVVTRDGTAYFTDSLSPYLYRVRRDAAGTFHFDRFLDFTGTALTYQPGFNVNGIAASDNGKYLIVAQSNTGKLFRVRVSTGFVNEIDLHGARVTADGILLRGRTLHAVQGDAAEVVKIRLSRTYKSGTIVSRTTDPSFIRPTTIARADGRLLVVNSQFNRRGAGLPPILPFTVSSIPIP